MGFPEGRDLSVLKSGCVFQQQKSCFDKGNVFNCKAPISPCSLKNTQILTLVLLFFWLLKSVSHICDRFVAPRGSLALNALFFRIIRSSHIPKDVWKKHPIFFFYSCNGDTDLQPKQGQVSLNVALYRNAQYIRF